jgi:hypothetical protein
MAGGLFARLAYDRHVQAAADDAGDVPERHTLFGDAVIAAPSPDVLKRIARALMLTDVEREHLFLLALGRPVRGPLPGNRGRDAAAATGARRAHAQPGLVKTSTLDIVAWNRAASAVLCHAEVRAAQPDWEGAARFVVAAFRAEAARAGAAESVKALVADLSRRSPEFEAMWSDNDVRIYGEGTKHLRHPVVGLISLEYSAFAVDGRPDLGMVVYNPATPADAGNIKSLLGPQMAASV